jgi:Fe2+ transport system protein FeoA
MSPEMPLIMATEGKEYKVVGLHHGRCNHGRYKRLVEMGFIEGAHLTVKNSHGRSIVVDLEGTKYVLCRGMANKIYVDEC